MRKSTRSFGRVALACVLAAGLSFPAAPAFGDAEGAQTPPRV